MPDRLNDAGVSLGGRILRASLAVGVAHGLFKLAGLVQVVLAGRLLDAGTYDAVYAFAFEGVVLSVFLLSDQAISPCFLPVFMEEKDSKGGRAAWDFANVVLSVQFLLLTAIVVLLVCFPEVAIRLVTGWDEARQPRTYALAKKAVTWLAPAVLCMSLAAVTYMLLNGYKRFFLAAFGDTSWRICTVLSLAVGMGVLGFDYRALIFGLAVGSAAKLLTHMVGLGGTLRFVRPSLALRNPAFGRMLWLMLPLVGGILLARARDIYCNVAVLSRLETEGLMMANSIGRKFFQSVGWLVPCSVSVAMFPFLCELVDGNDRERFCRLLRDALRSMLLLFVPLSLVCAVLAKPIVALLFGGGKFTAESVSWTAMSMASYVLVLPAYAIEYLLVKALFANRRMLAIVVTGVVASVLAIALSYVGVTFWGARDAQALAVVGLSYTVSQSLQVAIMLFVLKRTLPTFPLRQMGRFLLKVIVVGAVVAAGVSMVFSGLERLHPAHGERLMLTAQLTVCGGAALLLLIASAEVMGIEESRMMLDWISRKWVRRKA